MTAEPNGADSLETTGRPTWVRYQAVGLMALAAAIAYVVRNSAGVAESTIREELGLTLRQSGWFLGAFFWSYALLQVPSASFAQWLGTRSALTLFAVAWSVAALCIGASRVLWILLIAQLVMGASQAGIFPAACESISRWIPLSRRSFACGGLSTGMQIGAITASLLTGPLIAWIGWRWAFAVYAVPGLLWAACFRRAFRDDPHTHPAVNAAERRLIADGGVIVASPQQSATSTSAGDAASTRRTPWGRIFRSSAVFFLCVQQMCRAGGYMFFASWFPTFLQETRGVSVGESGTLQALVFSGTLLGSVCGGLLADWIWTRTGNLWLSRSGVGATFLLGCSLLVVTAWFASSTLLAVGLLAVGALFASLCGPSAYSAAIDIGGRHVPQVFGLMNMAGNLAAAACPILVAELVDRTNNWRMVLLVFAAIYLAGAVSWAFVDSRQRITAE